jgi:6,7-dimethyl-8-ribityllumazine synthase
MATSNLSTVHDYKPSDLTETYRVAIVAASWNQEVTGAMAYGAEAWLKEQHVTTELHWVPGSYELTLAAQWLAARHDVDAIIAIGCIIQGETRHFDFIAASVAQGLVEVNLKYNKPVIFSVLTTENQDQALARAGGVHGNKGIEGAMTALQMLDLKATIPSY